MQGISTNPPEDAAVCIIEIDADGAVGTGFLGVLPAFLPGLLFLVTCNHVIPNEASCTAAICTFEADSQLSTSLVLEPRLGFWTSKLLDVAVVRVASSSAFNLTRLQPYVLDLELEPVFGEALTFIGYCRQELTLFVGKSLGTSGQHLRVEVHGKLPEKGASGGPVIGLSGRAVGVHVGLFREDSGVEARSSLLRAITTEATSESFCGALRPKLPLPSQVQITGRRGTNDILNGVYVLVTTDDPGQASWVRVSPAEFCQDGQAADAADARRLILYKGSRSQAWTIGTRAGDGCLRSEGGLGGILARRLPLEDGNDPTEVCVGPAVANWSVAGGAAGKLQPDPSLRLKPLENKDFIQLQNSWRSLAQSAGTRLAAAAKEVEVFGFPGSMSVMNGKLYLQEPWNWHPAWRSKEGASQEVFLYRDASNTKWVLGFALGDGHERMAHVYTSFSSPAVGLVWEVDCGDHWLPYLPATVRTVQKESQRKAVKTKKALLPRNGPK